MCTLEMPSSSTTHKYQRIHLGGVPTSKYHNIHQKSHMYVTQEKKNKVDSPTMCKEGVAKCTCIAILVRIDNVSDS